MAVVDTVVGKLGHIKTCLLMLEGDMLNIKNMESQVPTALVDNDEPFFAGGNPKHKIVYFMTRSNAELGKS